MKWVTKVGHICMKKVDEMKPFKTTLRGRLYFREKIQVLKKKEKRIFF
jgi:hypothetical protein